jgi:hypothetical protein
MENKSNLISLKEKKVTKRRTWPDPEVYPWRDRRLRPTEDSSEVAEEVFVEEAEVSVADLRVKDAKKEDMKSIDNRVLKIEVVGNDSVIEDEKEAAEEEEEVVEAADLTIWDASIVDHHLVIDRPEVMDKTSKKTEIGMEEIDNKVLERIIVTIVTNAVEAREDFIAAFSAAVRVDHVLILRAVRVVSMEKPVVTRAELTSRTIMNREVVVVLAEVGSDLADVRLAFQEVVTDVHLEDRVRPTVTPVPELRIRT